MTPAYIALGSNLGRPQSQLRNAVSALETLPNAELVRYSSIYRSTAVGPGSQADYLNAVVLLETTLSPHALLAAMQHIEHQQGRVRNVHWGPRTLDLDLLLYGNQTIADPILTVPHPRMLQRDFVLYPLREISHTNLVLPNGSDLESLLRQCPDNGLVKTRYQLRVKQRRKSASHRRGCLVTPDTSSITVDLKGRSPPTFIAVEGPIGVGKTTLAKKLAASFNCATLLEDAHENPFLERFYRNREQVALATQLFFLFQRAQKIQDLRQADVFEPARIADFLMEKDPLFARLNLDPDEYQLYDKVYRQLAVNARKPDLVVYLQASTDVLLSRIDNRGLAIERTIDRGYLERLNEVYSDFFLYYDDAPLLIVNASEIDLANNTADYLNLVDYLLDIRSGRHYFNPSFFR